MGRNSRSLKKNSFFGYVFAENRAFLIYSIFCFTAMFLYIAYATWMGQGFYRFTLFKLCDDVFMDFYNSVRDAHMLDVRCYSERHVIYPPLANLFYAFISRFMNNDFITADDGHSLTWRYWLYDIFVYPILAIFIVVVIALVINNRTKGSSSKKFIFALLSVFSWPFVYMIERGNILSIAFLFLLLYVFYYDSENKVVSELACICLAVSAGIKLYPAVFGILLILDKRYKQAIRTVIYGILSVVLPMFAFYSGFEGIRLWLENIRRFTGMVSGSVYFPGSTTCKSGFYVLQRILGSGRVGVGGFADKMFTFLPLIVAIAAVVILPRKWQRFMALIFFAITVPGGGGSYSLVFLTIPLLFMMEEKKLRVFDYAYVLIITVQHMIFPIPMVAAQSMLGVNQLITPVTVMTLFLLLSIDLVIEVKKIVKKERPVLVKMERVGQ
ncbi:MAG: DUF2029 domain-containing protein [Clostridia bacterium]|nr:DUF2029 domain-containing protein [Clostridia bacterium]